MNNCFAADSDSCVSLIKEAHCKLKSGDRDGAERLLTEVVKSDPSCIAAIQSLSLFYDAQGNLEKARAVLVGSSNAELQVLLRSIEDRMISAYLSQATRQQHTFGDYQRALALLDKAIAVKDSSEIHIRRYEIIQILASKEKTKFALAEPESPILDQTLDQILRQLEAESSEEGKNRVSIARAYLAGGEHAKAITSLESRNPESGITHAALFKIYLEFAKSEKEKAIQLDPQSSRLFDRTNTTPKIEGLTLDK